VSSYDVVPKDQLQQMFLPISVGPAPSAQPQAPDAEASAMKPDAPASDMPHEAVREIEESEVTVSPAMDKSSAEEQ
jgi:hypothetical protein